MSKFDIPGKAWNPCGFVAAFRAAAQRMIEEYLVKAGHRADVDGASVPAAGKEPPHRPPGQTSRSECRLSEHS
jgi:hypothetical protein